MEEPSSAPKNRLQTSDPKANHRGHREIKPEGAEMMEITVKNNARDGETQAEFFYSFLDGRRKGGLYFFSCGPLPSASITKRDRRKCDD
jgi:hypothetical protein